MSVAIIKYQSRTDSIAKTVSALSLVTGSTIKLIVPLVKLHVQMINLYLFNQRAIKSIRAEMGICCEQCEKECYCLDSIHKGAIRIRGYMSGFASDLKKTASLTSIPLHIAEALLIDWDDIVEDCVIGTDPDIRISISRIAELC